MLEQGQVFASADYDAAPVITSMVTGGAGSSAHLPVNLGNPTEHTILELAGIIVELAGSTSTITFEELPEDDPTVRRPDVSLARRLFGWDPRVTLADGLRATIDSLDAGSRQT